MIAKITNFFKRLFNSIEQTQTERAKFYVRQYSNWKV